MESTDTIVIAKVNKPSPPAPAAGSIKRPLKFFWSLIEDLPH